MDYHRSTDGDAMDRLSTRTSRRDALLRTLAPRASSAPFAQMDSAWHRRFRSQSHWTQPPSASWRQGRCQWDNRQRHHHHQGDPSTGRTTTSLPEPHVQALSSGRRGESIERHEDVQRASRRHDSTEDFGHCQRGYGPLPRVDGQHHHRTRRGPRQRKFNRGAWHPSTLPDRFTRRFPHLRHHPYHPSNRLVPRPFGLRVAPIIMSGSNRRRRRDDPNEDARERRQFTGNEGQHSRSATLRDYRDLQQASFSSEHGTDTAPPQDVGGATTRSTQTDQPNNSDDDIDIGISSAAHNPSDGRDSSPQHSRGTTVGTDTESGSAGASGEAQTTVRCPEATYVIQDLSIQASSASQTTGQDAAHDEHSGTDTVPTGDDDSDDDGSIDGDDDVHYAQLERALHQDVTSAISTAIEQHWTQHIARDRERRRSYLHQREQRARSRSAHATSRRRTDSISTHPGPGDGSLTRGTASSYPAPPYPRPSAHFHRTDRPWLAPEIRTSDQDPSYHSEAQDTTSTACRISGSAQQTPRTIPRAIVAAILAKTPEDHRQTTSTSEDLPAQSESPGTASPSRATSVRTTSTGFATEGLREEDDAGRTSPEEIAKEAEGPTTRTVELTDQDDIQKLQETLASLKSTCPTPTPTTLVDTAVATAEKLVTIATTSGTGVKKAKLTPTLSMTLLPPGVTGVIDTPPELKLQWKLDDIRRGEERLALLAKKRGCLCNAFPGHRPTKEEIDKNREEQLAKQRRWEQGQEVHIVQLTCPECERRLKFRERTVKMEPKAPAEVVSVERPSEEPEDSSLLISEIFPSISALFDRPDSTLLSESDQDELLNQSGSELKQEMEQYLGKQSQESERKEGISDSQVTSTAETPRSSTGPSPAVSAAVPPPQIYSCPSGSFIESPGPDEILPAPTLASIGDPKTEVLIRRNDPQRTPYIMPKYSLELANEKGILRENMLYKGQYRNLRGEIVNLQPVLQEDCEDTEMIVVHPLDDNIIPASPNASFNSIQFRANVPLTLECKRTAHNRFSVKMIMKDAIKQVLLQLLCAHIFFGHTGAQAASTEDGDDLQRQYILPHLAEFNATFGRSPPTIGNVRNQFVGFDCTRPEFIKDFSYNTPPKCSLPEEAIKDLSVTGREKYLIYQKLTNKRLDGVRCYALHTRTAYHCGQHYHTTIDPTGSFDKRAYRLSIDECVMIMNDKKFKDPTGRMHDVIRGTNDLEWFAIGKTYTTDDGGPYCKGGSWIHPSSQAVLSGMVVHERLELSVEEEEFRVNYDSKVVTTETMKHELRCPESSMACSFGPYTYAWIPDVEQECPFAYTREVEGITVNNEDGDYVFMSTDGTSVRFVLKDQQTFCGGQVYSTHNPILFLWKFGDRPLQQTGKIDPKDVSIATYFKEADSYILEHLMDAIEREFARVMIHTCEQQVRDRKYSYWSEHSDPGLTTWILGNNTFATSSGEVIYQYLCEPLLVQAVEADQCYESLPVRLIEESLPEGYVNYFKNHHLFLEPLTHRITLSGIPIPCSSQFPAKYRNVEGKWLSITPTLNASPKPGAYNWYEIISLQRNAAKKFKTSRFDTGTYEFADVQAAGAYLDHGRTIKDISSQIANQIVKGNRVKTDGSGSYITPGIMFPGEKMWFNRAYDKTIMFLEKFGTVCSILFGLHAIISIIKSILTWLHRLFVLRDIHGCGLHLLFAPITWMFKATQMYKEQQEQKVEKHGKPPSGGLPPVVQQQPEQQPPQQPPDLFRQPPPEYPPPARPRPTTLELREIARPATSKETSTSVDPPTDEVSQTVVKRTYPDLPTEGEVHMYAPVYTRGRHRGSRTSYMDTYM